MKSQLTITVDTELLKRAKIKKLNVSEECERGLMLKVNFMDNNTEEFDKEVLNKELKDCEEIFYEKQQQIIQIKGKLEQIKEKQLENDKKELEKTKNKTKLEKSCLNCGILLGNEENVQKFPKGLVCQSCYMAGNKESMKKWGY